MATTMTCPCGKEFDAFVAWLEHLDWCPTDHIGSSAAPSDTDPHGQ